MADDVWKRLDRGIKAARTRVNEQPDEHGFRASHNIKEMTKLRWVIEDLIDAETIRGRDQGASWVLLGSSKQQAQQRYKRAVARRG